MQQTTPHHVQTGLEVVLETGLPQLQGKRVGLVTNATGADRRLQSTVDLLMADERIQLRALFGPEHGIRGDAQAGVEVEEALDQRTGLPVYSLFGSTRRPTPHMLKDLDALIYDIQDVGVRYYTYIATLLYVQEAAAQAGLEFVVLDRPNPLGGTQIDGNLLDPAFTSFVGIYPIPIRHGLTSGELARLFAAEHNWPEPTVISMRGWRRDLWFDETDLPWLQASPNLPTLDSVTLYPGTCLFEGTSCSEGRGTTRPFECVGAPGLDPFQLVAELNRRDIPGVAFRPIYFTPTFSKRAQQTCGGVQVHILDRNSIQAVELGLHLLHAVRGLLGPAFTWIQGKENNTYFADLLFGSDKPRLAFNAGAEVAEILAGWEQQSADFRARRRPFLLYE
jgi:uncharacterized protein YbbC (DUF1343 family)